MFDPVEAICRVDSKEVLFSWLSSKGTMFWGNVLFFEQYFLQLNCECVAVGFPNELVLLFCAIQTALFKCSIKVLWFNLDTLQGAFRFRLTVLKRWYRRQDSSQNPLNGKKIKLRRRSKLCVKRIAIRPLVNLSHWCLLATAIACRKHPSLETKLNEIVAISCIHPTVGPSFLEIDLTLGSQVCLFSCVYH